jgi:hypothetical protein
MLWLCWREMPALATSASIGPTEGRCKTSGKASSPVMQRRRRPSSAAEPAISARAFRPILAPRTAGVDVHWTFRIAAVDVAVGRIPALQEAQRKGGIRGWSRRPARRGFKSQRREPSPRTLTRNPHVYGKRGGFDAKRLGRGQTLTRRPLWVHARRRRFHTSRFGVIDNGNITRWRRASGA